MRQAEMTSIRQFSTLFCRLLVLLLFAVYGLHPTSAAEMPFSQGLLFQVERPGKPVSYLFGTIHSEDARVLALPKPVDQAFLKSSRLFVEVDMNPANLSDSLTMMFLDGERNLPQILGTSLYAQSVELAARRGLPEVAIRHYKPWALAMLLSLPPTKTGQFLDLMLYQRALQLNKPVAGLETVREQLDLFDALPETDQIVLLRDALNNSMQLPTLFQALLESYLQRDLKGLVELNERFLEEGNTDLNRRLQDKLLNVRNQRMVDRLQNALAEGGAFIAVGALHLPGEQGMLNLLEWKGYRVTRIY